MTDAASNSGAQESARLRPPGFLLTPFGWAAEPLIVLLQGEPALSGELAYLTRSRMHLIALALSHAGDTTPSNLPNASSGVLGDLLLRGPAVDILDNVIGHRPTGLKRVIRRLPHYVLTSDSYRRIVQLLVDPVAAKALHHSPIINDDTISIMAQLPQSLRAVVLSLQPWPRELESLGDGLRYLVRRGGASSFDALVAELACARQPQQFVAKIKVIVDRLPLPAALPSPQIGNARRLDFAVEIRSLAAQWRNCLERYIRRVDNGECAVYIWQDAEIEAACLVRRRGRLGWFLDDVKGPGNAEIESRHLQMIDDAFGAVGVPRYSIIEAIEDIIEMAAPKGLRHHLPGAGEDRDDAN